MNGVTLREKRWVNQVMTTDFQNTQQKYNLPAIGEELHQSEYEDFINRIANDILQNHPDSNYFEKLTVNVLLAHDLRHKYSVTIYAKDSPSSKAFKKAVYSYFCWAANWLISQWQ